MRHARPYLLLLGLIIFVGLGATLNRSQPPLGRTGAPSELNCSNGCHVGTVNSGPGSISLNTPAQYTPGQTYNLTLLLTDNTKSRFGFELTALNASNSAAGTFAVGSGNASVRTGNFGGGTRRYVSHTNGSTNSTWGINWTAPSTNVGNVTFYVAGNATNANGGTTGDNVYTQTFTLTPAAQPPTAAFSVNKSQLCEGETVTFQNQSSGSINTYSWDFGTGATPATATGAGPHTVTYAGAGNPEAKLITAGPGGISRDSTILTVFALPTTSIIPPTGILCEGTPTTLRASSSPMGSTFSYLWSNNSTADSAIVSTSASYSLVVTDQNGCQDTDTLMLSFNPTPSPTINGLNNTFCTQSGSVALSGSPVGGIFSGNGVLPGDLFNPDSAGTGTHTINYVVTSPVGCVGSIAETVEVFQTITITGSTLPDSLCLNTTPVNLQSTPAGGVFSGPGVANNSFDPTAAGLGVHQVQVIVTGGAGCADTTTFAVTVNSVPATTISLDNTFCTQTGSVSLNGSPAGGIFSGNGVLPGDLFNPDSAGIGTHIISYAVTSVSGCIGSISDTVEVFETINITGSTLPDSLCLDAAVVSLQSTPAGGVFSGPGVTNSSFDPTAAGLGIHPVQVIITSSEGCADTTTFSVVVNPLPAVNITNGAAGTIETQAGFSTYSWAFIDTLSGNTTSLPGFNSPNFDPAPFANSPSNTGVMVVTVTDSLGCSATSDPFVLPATAITPSLFSQLDVFPNPASNQLNIHFQLLQPSRLEMKLFDIKGAVLQRYTSTNVFGEKLKWDLRELPGGMYFLQVQTEKGSLVQKVVKK